MNRLQWPIKRTARHRHRGVALMLAMIAIIVSGTVAYSYLGSQSTSVGIARNIRSSGKARFVAESGMEVAVAAVRENANWRSDRPNGTWITDQSLAGGTFTIVGEDGSDTDGDGDVDGDGDLTDSGGDLLTLTVTGKADGAAHVVRAVLTPSRDGMMFYGEATSTSPRYRTWSGSAWSSQQVCADISAYARWIVAARCPTRTETAACYLDSDYDLNLQFYTGTCSSPTELTTSTVQNAQRPYDIAYEQSSGDLLMAYRTSADNTLHYRTYNGSTVSSDAGYTLTVTAGLHWVRLAPKAASDEITVMTLDANKDVCAAIWSGSSFSNAVTLEINTSGTTNEGIAAGYETSSGDGLVIWTQNGRHLFQYRTYSGGSWSAEAESPTLGTKEPLWVRLVADPASNKMIAGSLDGNNDLYVVDWTGSAWGTPVLLDAGTPDNTSRQFDIAFENGGTQAIVVWGRSGVDNFYYRTWNGSSWSSEQTGPGLAEKVAFAQTVTGAAADEIFVTIQNKADPPQLETFLWNGTSFSSLGTVTSLSSGSSTQEGFRMAVPPIGSIGGGYTYSVDWR